MRITLGSGTRFGAARLYGLAFAAVGALLASPFKLGVVQGGSMEPTLRNGQVYLMDRTHYLFHPVERGDVIVFYRDGTAYVKRVAAAPGDEIYLLRMRGDTGEDLVIPAHQLSMLRRVVQSGPWSATHRLIRRRVPEGHYYVLGDHREVSIDSRKFGLVSRNEVYGHVLGIPGGPAPGERLAVHRVNFVGG